MNVACVGLATRDTILRVPMLPSLGLFGNVYERVISPASALLVFLSAFRIVGVGHPIPSEIDRGPCPDGRWQQALYAASAPRRIGTVYGCGLTIRKTTSPGRDPAAIGQTAREHFVLPGRAFNATCTELFVFNRDQHHSRATFRCRIDGGGTITGGGPALDGHANYLLKLS